MFPFRRKKDKKTIEHTPPWFKWLLGGFMAYAVLSSLLADDVDELTREQPDQPATQNIKLDALNAPDVSVMQRDNAPPFVRLELREGKGMSARCWDTVMLRYTLFNAEGEVENNYDAKAPMTVTLGKGMVIPALERGVLAMRVGSVRDILARPDYAFDAQGFDHSDIQQNEPVAYRVEMVDAFSPSLPDESETGMALRIFDGETDQGEKGLIAQCTDTVRVTANLLDMRSQPVWDTPKTLTFRLGAGEVAYAIEKGAMGMAVGSKRTLIVPPGFMQPIDRLSGEKPAAVYGPQPLVKTTLPEEVNAVMLLELELRQLNPNE